MEQKNGGVERGLKTRLKRKQDIIEYIEKHQRTLSNVDEEVINGDTKAVQENQNKNESSSQHLNLPSEIASNIPSFLADKMLQRDIRSLLPIQAKSFPHIFNGEDVILQSPTGSGKTLAFALPILARKWKGGGRRKHNQASPFVLVLLPSRELARQVGREIEKFAKGGGTSVATVFGGVSVERHIALLKSKPQIIVSTPGRLRELVREGHIDFSQIRTVVLDEADVLLDKGDSPDVRTILEDLERAVGEREEKEAEYQLVLVSATMNDHVLQFAREMGIPPKAKIRVQGSESKMLPDNSWPEETERLSSSMIREVKTEEKTQRQTTSQSATAQAVQHWHMACKKDVRTSVAMDLISILMPRLTLIFVATKAEAEGVASVMSGKLGNGVVRALHGDMTQNSRSRTMALVRETALDGDSQVLVATDVASRGIDLWVDLVIQFGVPRITGKEGTFNAELYTHRTGRTGRVRSNQPKGAIRSSNTIMLYDPASGEGKLVAPLAEEIQSLLGVEMLPKQLPSAAEVVAAGYDRARRAVNIGDKRPDQSDLVTYFRSVLETEEGVDTSNPEELLEYLSRSMALLSNLDPAVSPFNQRASLLTGSTTERTLRLYKRNNMSISPPEATIVCKDLGSGKLGRVQICEDGSAIFDLPTQRAKKLSEAFRATESEFELEVPLTLPNLH